jgi:FixJ family two-component response regulator
MAMCNRSAEKSTRRLVLLVDDDTRVRESLKGLFGSAGIETLSFDSGEALLRSNVLATSSCLITDVRMPGMDGWELQGLVSKIHPHVLIIFISAFQDSREVERAFALGAFALLHKPFDGEDLLRIVEAALSQSAGL